MCCGYCSQRRCLVELCTCFTLFRNEKSRKKQKKNEKLKLAPPGCKSPATTFCTRNYEYYTYITTCSNIHVTTSTRVTFSSPAGSQQANTKKTKIHFLDLTHESCTCNLCQDAVEICFPAPGYRAPFERAASPSRANILLMCVCACVCRIVEDGLHIELSD